MRCVLRIAIAAVFLLFFAFTSFSSASFPFTSVCLAEGTETELRLTVKSAEPYAPDRAAELSTLIAHMGLRVREDDAGVRELALMVDQEPAVMLRFLGPQLDILRTEGLLSGYIVPDGDAVFLLQDEAGLSDMPLPDPLTPLYPELDAIASQVYAVGTGIETSRENLGEFGRAAFVFHGSGLELLSKTEDISFHWDAEGRLLRCAWTDEISGAETVCLFADGREQTKVTQGKTQATLDRTVLSPDDVQMALSILDQDTGESVSVSGIYHGNEGRGDFDLTLLLGKTPWLEGTVSMSRRAFSGTLSMQDADMEETAGADTRERIVRQVASCLLREWVLLPYEDTLFISKDIPRDTWNQLARSTWTVWEEDEEWAFFDASFGE